MRLRSAAAAAAEDRLLEEGWDLRKAWEAAEAADCDEGDESCQISMLVSPLIEISRIEIPDDAKSFSCAGTWLVSLEGREREETRTVVQVGCCRINAGRRIY